LGGGRISHACRPPKGSVYKWGPSAIMPQALSSQALEWGAPWWPKAIPGQPVNKLCVHRWAQIVCDIYRAAPMGPDWRYDGARSCACQPGRDVQSWSGLVLFLEASHGFFFRAVGWIRYQGKRRPPAMRWPGIVAESRAEFYEGSARLTVEEELLF